MEVLKADIAAGKLLGGIELVPGCNEMDFIFAGLAKTVEARRAGELDVSPVLVLEAAFRQDLSPFIETTPGRARRRIIEAIANFDQNGLIAPGIEADSFLTMAGQERLEAILQPTD